ncbi:MAG: Hsp70 family protein [Tannerellaceae bacterium]|jgi:molecular chaperone DnaK|nr:Hsp70 family protein [Tannerellaceae bacterium]
MGKELTSEELSAEVLKKLKSFVLEDISSIVITVPAEFISPQKRSDHQGGQISRIQTGP